MDEFAWTILAAALFALALLHACARGFGPRASKPWPMATLIIIAIGLALPALLLLAGLAFLNAALGLMADRVSLMRGAMSLYALGAVGVLLLAALRTDPTAPPRMGRPLLLLLLSACLFLASLTFTNLRQHARLAAHDHAATIAARELHPPLPLDNDLRRERLRDLLMRIKALPWDDLDWDRSEELDDEERAERRTIELARDFPADLRPLVAELRQIVAEPPVIWFDDYASLSIETLLPYLGESRTAATFLQWHALTAARDGRLDEAAQDLRAMQQLAGHTVEPPMLVSVLVGIGIQAKALDTLAEVLPYASDETILDNLAPGDASWARRDVARSLQLEQASLGREMARILRGKGNLATLTNIGNLPSGVWVLYRLFADDRDLRAYRDTLDTLRLAVEDQQLTFEQLLARNDEFDEQVIAAKSQGLLVSILLPSLTRAVENSALCVAQHDFAHAAIAARRHELRTGRLPAAADELIAAGLLDKAPADPLANSPAIWKLDDDQLLIYSVGRNRADNGGPSQDRSDDVGIRLRTAPYTDRSNGG